MQIHNWANNFEDDSPNLEFVAPTAAYVVVNGVKTHVELAAVPPLTPRQTRLINGTPELGVDQGGAGVVMEEQPDSTYDNKEARRATRDRLQKYVRLMKQDGLEGMGEGAGPTWQTKITTKGPPRSEKDNSTFVDHLFSQGVFQGWLGGGRWGEHLGDCLQPCQSLAVSPALSLRCSCKLVPAHLRC